MSKQTRDFGKRLKQARLAHGDLPIEMWPVTDLLCVIHSYETVIEGLKASGRECCQVIINAAGAHGWEIPDSIVSAMEDFGVEAKAREVRGE